MNFNDVIGIIGVGLILLAYFGNTFKLIKNNSALFFTLNMIGGALATSASFLIHYWPFVILEGTWCLVSLIGLAKVLR
jgi:hypothetical protein